MFFYTSSSIYTSEICKTSKVLLWAVLGMDLEITVGVSVCIVILQQTALYNYVSSREAQVQRQALRL